MGLIDFQGIGLVEVPDDITDAEIQELGENLSKSPARSAAASAGQSFQRSVGQAVSGARRGAEYLRVPTQIPVGMGGFGMRDETARNLLDLNREIAKEQALEPERREARLAASPTYQLGQEIAAQAPEVFQPNPLYKGDFWTETIPTGAGQLPLLIGAGAVGGPLGAGAMYGAMAGEATVQEADTILDQRIAEAAALGDTALAARLERSKANAKSQAFVAGASIGAATEATLGVAGRVVPAIRNATQLAGTTIAGKAVQGALREAAQEGSEQVLGNIAAQKIYEPSRLTLEGVGESMAAGAVLGGGLAVGAESVRPRLVDANTQKAVNDLAPTSPQTAQTLELMKEGLAIAERSSARQLALEAPAIDVEATEVAQPLPEPRQLSVSPENQMVVDETGQPAVFTQPQPETTDAVQEQGTDEGVLRPEQPQVGLQGVVEQDTQQEEAPDVLPTQGEEVTPEAPYNPSDYPLPPLSDENTKYRGKLSRFVPRVYRETSISSASPIIPGTTTTTQLGELFFSNTPEYALGQGANKGVVMEFDSDGIEGVLSRSKPAWLPAYESGNAEFVARQPAQSEIQNALVSVTVKPDATATRVERVMFNRVTSGLESNGWTKTTNEDGSVTWRKPSSKPSTPRRTQAPPVQEPIPEVQAAIPPEPSVSEPVTPETPASEQMRQNRDAVNEASNEFFKLGIQPAPIEVAGKYLSAKAKDAWGRVAAGFQRNFTSRGDLPDSVFQESIKRTGKIKAMEQEGKYITRDFNRTLREVYGLNRAGMESNLQQVPKEDIQKFNAYLTKEDDGSTIDPRVREQLGKMRSHLDNLSNELVRRGLVDSKLEKVVTDNLGVYLTRSYRFFDDPKWADNIPKERLNKARNFILSEMRRSNPAATEQDADRQVRNMIEDWKKDGVDSFVRGGKLGGKDFYTFFKRKDIAPEIRALLGEYQDPQVNFTRSVAKIARYLGDQEFLNKVKQDGMGKFLFESDQAPAGYNTLIATEGSSTMEPLNGLRTSPEIAKVFEEYGKRDNANGLWKAIMALNAFTKTAATVGSVQTQMRNLWGQIYFNTMNGDFRLNNYGKSAKSVLADLGAMSDPEWRKQYANYLRLGVVGDSTIAGEIRESVKAVFNRDMQEDDFSWRSIVHFAKKYGMDKPAEIYQAADDLGKITAFESRKADVKAIHPTWTDKQVEEQAAREIREDYPTHQMASRAVRAFRRQPFLGSFATFNAEMMRSTYNSLNRTRQYLFENNGNEAMRNIGIRRAVGALTALGGASAGIAALSRLLSEVSPEDDDDVRQFVPSYEQNSNLVYLGKSDDGAVRYIDESRFNPYAMFGDATRAMFSNDEKGIQSALWEGLVELTGGYADESLILSKVADVNRNKTETGRKVYNDEATTGDKLYESAKHVGEVLVPGTVKRATTRLLPAITGTENRRGVVPSLPAELAREGLGVSIEDIDFERALEFRARDFPKRISESTSIFTSELYKRGEKDPQKVLDSYQAQENARLGIWTDLYNQASAAIRQGVPRDEVQSILESNGVGKRDARLILNGNYRAYRPSKEVLERAKDRNRAIPTTELDALATERDALRLSDELPPVEPQAPVQWPVF